MHLYHKEDGEDIFKKQVRWNIKFLRNVGNKFMIDILSKFMV